MVAPPAPKSSTELPENEKSTHFVLPQDVCHSNPSLGLMSGGMEEKVRPKLREEDAEERAGRYRERGIRYGKDDDNVKKEGRDEEQMRQKES